MIVVTGGATGLGRAIATQFVRAGHRVLITGRRAELLRQTAAEVGAEALPCDNSVPGDLDRLSRACDEPVTALVNNAGGNTDLTRLPPTGLSGLAEAWTANWTANVLTAVLTTTALDAQLADGGAVVNVGSIAADKGAGSYGAAKAAVSSWTVHLARELGPRGIRVNAVSPGYIAGTEFFHGLLSREREQDLLDATLTHLHGHPDDVAATVLFLASPAARHIAGQTIAVNGGAWTTR